MPKIPTLLEQELLNHAPARLDPAYLERLTSCAEETFTDLPALDEEFAARLAAAKPRPVPAALQSSLAAELGGTPFAVDGKIVLFHGGSKGGPVDRRSIFRRTNVAAAAAVAVLGAAAALLVPQRADTSTAAAAPTVVRTLPNAQFAPAGYGRDLSETRDEGVIWRGKNQPHRVLRLTYMEKVTMQNARGETYQVERPHHEYVIIPEKID